MFQYKPDTRSIVSSNDGSGKIVVLAAPSFGQIIVMDAQVRAAKAVGRAKRRNSIPQFRQRAQLYGTRRNGAGAQLPFSTAASGAYSRNVSPSAPELGDGNQFAVLSAPGSSC